ncbi:hypothetical protein ACP275_07G115500 [Erythranthe tilingii]
MYGQPGLFRPGGGGGGCGVPQPPQHQQIHLNPNLFPNPNLFFPQQTPNLWPHFNPFLQNPNIYPQNQQQFTNSNFPIQLNYDNNNNVQAPHPNGNNNSSCTFPPQCVNSQREIVDELDNAVIRARAELLGSNQNVSSWKVSQEALLMVKAESWESLGFKMQQVPSLKHLMIIEGKINAFMHCFVEVRRITSLYEMEVAICESEGIEQFEELGLGPLLQHPLVVHYFSVTSDVTEVYRIRNEEIISYIREFIDTHKKTEIRVDTFLDFICEKQSVSSREKLCVRVQNLGVYINHIKKAKQSEDNVLEKCYEKIRTESVKKSPEGPLISSQKKETDDEFTIKSFSSLNTQFCGKHIRFTSSSSDDDSEANEYNEKNTERENYSLPLTNSRPDRVSKCPYPSATEEITRLSSKRKRKHEKMSCGSSLPRKKRNKRNVVDAIIEPTIEPTIEPISSSTKEIGCHPLSDESLRIFVKTWKEICQGSNADEKLFAAVKSLLENCLSTKIEERTPSVLNISNWPPVDWKTAPGFSSTSASGLKKPREGIFGDKNIEQSDISISGISTEFNIEVDPKTIAIAQGSVSPETDISETRSNNSSTFITTNCTDRDEVFAEQMQLTGRLGELVASKYFVDKLGEACVNWVNEKNETGLPYDIVLGDDENTREYIEVKATKSVKKNWFLISMREWQFAIEKGESFSIAHVILADDNMAKVTVYKNPARLCQLGSLRLSFVVPN